MTDEAQTQAPPPMGGNQPPLPDRLAIDYAAMTEAVEAIAKRANAAPQTIESTEDHALLVALVKDARTQGKSVEAKRVDEKAPFLAAERQVDDFFVPMRDRATKIVASMEKRIKVYLDAIAARERAAREAEAARQREREDAARREAKAALQAAAAARQNADVHETKLQEAATATATAKAAGGEARAAEKAANQKPAELARTRTSEGLSTLKTFWDFEIIDEEAISLVALRDFIPRDAIEKAVRAFVRVHGGSRPLAGVRIFEDTKAETR